MKDPQMFKETDMMTGESKKFGEDEEMAEGEKLAALKDLVQQMYKLVVKGHEDMEMKPADIKTAMNDATSSVVEKSASPKKLSKEYPEDLSLGKKEVGAYTEDLSLPEAEDEERQALKDFFKGRTKNTNPPKSGVKVVVETIKKLKKPNPFKGK